ncbi:4'-phosphopantetheinyl transferase superfamily protein [Hyphobacterium sp. CCMP332]|nr:4'-phosphopantetheinyl transferase superfamily protein [Hyphobacterium sp. CCMP332]
MSYKFEILLNDDNNMVGIAPVIRSSNISPNLFLHKEELRELKLITNPTYKNQWLSARWLASQCKKQIKKEKVNEILKNQEGKPYLRESTLHVSLSHNKNIAAVMFSNYSCGIDVELFREKIIRIQDKFLTTKEKKQFSQNIPALTLIWSAKESVYKMLGIPGLIFKEQIDCEIIEIKEEDSFNTWVRINPNKIIGIKVNYRIFEKELLTFCHLGDSHE